ncbi:hypothetical protein [Pseudanabaena sp. ABRG5-3]|jgi:hypothetical protein|uniref:hypothetical protein n=1 Tax=Pseudanabaena sp. ABRG5-3 TaxID=685565 RepID=UPI000DC6D1D4|nr:hypothetical protein [Pseudanabaena sp. ABRG5-3]BBC25759.1 hypothetical protein ABRG53_3502 [Pseudanabaena sp. ABRG5-3]
MEIIGALLVTGCLWLSQHMNDSDKKKEQEMEKKIKEKLKNDQYVNIRIIEQPKN